MTVAATVQNIAESWCMHPYGVEPLPPKFLPNPPVAGRHRLGFRPAPITPRFSFNRPDVSEDWAYVLFEGQRLTCGGWGAGRWRSLLSRLRAVLWSCSSAVSTGLGLRRRLGSVVVVGPPYAGKVAFVKQLLEQRAWRHI
jgi:hypothetical protein